MVGSDKILDLSERARLAEQAEAQEKQLKVAKVQMICDSANQLFSGVVCNSNQNFSKEELRSKAKMCFDAVDAFLEVMEEEGERRMKNV